MRGLHVVGRDDPLAGCDAALNDHGILILFPEGSRGEPEQLGAFKSGIAHLARRHPALPVIPVFMHGLGKVLPRGELLPVPFFVDVFVGEAMGWTGDRASFEDCEGPRVPVDDFPMQVREARAYAPLAVDGAALNPIRQWIEVLAAWA